MLKQNSGLTCRQCSHNRAANKGKLLHKQSMCPLWYLIVDCFLLVVRLMHVCHSNSNSCCSIYADSSLISFSNLFKEAVCSPKICVSSANLYV